MLSTVYPILISWFAALLFHSNWCSQDDHAFAYNAGLSFFNRCPSGYIMLEESSDLCRLAFLHHLSERVIRDDSIYKSSEHLFAIGSFFSKLLTKDTPRLPNDAEIWNVLCESIVWSLTLIRYKYITIYLDKYKYKCTNRIKTTIKKHVLPYVKLTDQLLFILDFQKGVDLQEASG